MTQPGETDGHSACDHIKMLVKHSHQHIFDYCILNTGLLPHQMLKRYELEESYPVINDFENIRKLGYRVIGDDIVVSEDAVRHDPVKLAKIILGIIEEA
jgi:2-phospho-L-lactate transferase/gluconeogenesis factor (CofD/UPF0052 family)